MKVVKNKLIEVALLLDAINAATVREKSIRYGHPSTLHQEGVAKAMDLRHAGPAPFVEREPDFGELIACGETPQ